MEMLQIMTGRFGDPLVVFLPAPPVKTAAEVAAEKAARAEQRRRERVEELRQWHAELATMKRRVESGW